MAAAGAAAQLAALEALAARSDRHVVYTPPEMVPHWQPEYLHELTQAAASALASGASAAKVFALLEARAARDLEALPEPLLALCVEAGLSVDTDMGGESLLHWLLNAPAPPALGADLEERFGGGTQQQPAASPQQQGQQQPGRQQAAQLLDVSHPACGSATLASMLRCGATPDLQDRSGNTALHMVVACACQQVWFPDPTVEDQAAKAAAGEPADGEPAVSEAAAGEAKQLCDNDGPRAAYLGPAFKALLAAGWQPMLRNHNGYTVLDHIESGLTRYQTELADLRDPDGVPQTTVALLSKRAPDKGLQEFLDAKIAGVAAMVDTLLELHRLSSAAQAPRARRTGLLLVAMWLVLLAACVYGIVLARRGGW